MGFILALVSLAAGSLWLVERGVKDLDERLELRRQSLWGFESLRQRVASYHHRRDDGLVAEREAIKLAYAQVVQDWRHEQPIAGLFPILRSSDQNLELVLVSTDGDSDGDREQ